jgi:predicted acetyltransferase
VTPAPVSKAHAETILGEARDGSLRLSLDAIYSVTSSPWAVPAYRFHIFADESRAGTISLRIGNDDRLVRFAGHIGFSVDPPFRGQRLAGRAVRLLLPLAASHRLDPVWLGCNPDNHASMAVMQWLGACYIETVEIPADYVRYYQRGERQKRRYRLDNGSTLAAFPHAP